MSEHHKTVQLTEIEGRLRGLEEVLGLVPGWMSRLRLALGVSASEP
ncbi:MAG: hypothetical protein ACREXW_18770 [Gammaproteobacteria bacterium]